MALIEYFGGPRNGQIEDGPEPGAGIVHYRRGEDLPDGTHVVGPAYGRYFRIGSNTARWRAER
jgi:hypothetical protein